MLRPTLACRAVRALLVAAMAVLMPVRAFAHAASDGYLTLTFGDGPAVVGSWDLALSDLDAGVPLEAGPNGTIAPSDVRAQADAIVRFAFAGLALRGDGAPCPIDARASDLGFTDREGRIYVSLPFVARCAAPPVDVVIDYTLFFDKEPQHRGLTRIEDGATSRSVIFSSRFRREELRRKERDRPHELMAALRSGVAHIATGTDHLLFLLVLLLPSVLVPATDGASWQPVPRLRGALLEVLKVVSAFTLAHSVTLSLAVLDVVRLPPRFVEPAIAASIVVAALLNLRAASARRQARWPVAFALGLLHGFGFSASLVDLGLRRSDLVVTLLGFNLGVEAGQLTAVALFLPVAFALRRWRGYRRVIVQGGSLLTMVIAAVWFVQRLSP